MTKTADIDQLHDSTPFHIREAVVDDAENLVDYLEIILSDPMASIADLDEMTLNSHRQREHLRRAHDNPKALALIAEHNGEIIGFLTMEPGRRRKIAHTVEIGMSVREDWRGHRVGQALLEYAENWARYEGEFEKLVLNVFSDNIAALKLYQKDGFFIEGMLKDQIKIDGKTQDMILMAKFISPKSSI